jgi:hypothetical protein
MEECEGTVSTMRSESKRAHYVRVQEDYEALKLWLPEKVSDVLDIGCGLPVIDMWLARHYGGKGVTFHLMDGDERINPIGKNQIGYQKITEPWKSRYRAIEYLSKEAPGCEVMGYPGDPSLTIPCDLIISRRAWGHHFSIRMYMDLVDRSLRPNGRIITDIRIGTPGIETFEARGFKVLRDDLEVRSIKCKRIVLSR